MPKFFVNKGQINENRIHITGEDANHIANVLRSKLNDLITVCDGEGTDYECTLVEINKKEIVAEIISSRPNKNEPDIKITLYQSLPKSDKMEFIIQKCIEIGVDRIVPVKTEHTVVKLDKKEDKKLERWKKIAEAAAKQCGRGKIPLVDNILTFKEAISQAKNLDSIIIPYEKQKEGGLKEYVNQFSGKSIGIFIGPEGGFSPQEVSLAIENGAVPVTLGKRILRTETAGLVTCVILLYELEGWS